MRPSAPVRLAALAVVLSTATAPAVADKGDGARPYPSRSQVEAAEAEVDRTAHSVEAIQAELASATQQLEQAAVAAEQAAEAYNGARWRLSEAEAALAKARAQAARAGRSVARQRDSIAALVTQTYVAGGDLTALDAFADAEGPEGLMDRYLAYEGASASIDAAYQRFTVASRLADAFEHEAEQALRTQQVAAQEARTARDEAAAAAASAQAVTAEVAGRKEALLARLAEAEGISLTLARQRQAALDEIAQRRAARDAARKADAEAAAQQAAAAAAKAAEAKQAQLDQQKQQKQQKDDERPGTSAPSDSAPAPDPAPDPTPDPPPARGGAARAIAFAKAQLGEPYRWGADGPDAWDCSGLTMAAWAAAGVSLPHYSVAQYSAGTPISVGDLRPGDLVFWGSSSSPSSIHHVALYLGGGQIIHAPRTGRPVAIDSMYYWVPPNFFARV